MYKNRIKYIALAITAVSSIAVAYYGARQMDVAYKYAADAVVVAQDVARQQTLLRIKIEKKKQQEEKAAQELAKKDKEAKSEVDSGGDARVSTVSSTQAQQKKIAPVPNASAAQSGLACRRGYAQESSQLGAAMNKMTDEHFAAIEEARRYYDTKQYLAEGITEQEAELSRPIVFDTLNGLYNEQMAQYNQNSTALTEKYSACVARYEYVEPDLSDILPQTDP